MKRKERKERKAGGKDLTRRSKKDEAQSARRFDRLADERKLMVESGTGGTVPKVKYSQRGKIGCERSPTALNGKPKMKDGEKGADPG